jgi:hypothetical protein
MLTLGLPSVSRHIGSAGSGNLDQGAEDAPNPLGRRWIHRTSSLSSIASMVPAMVSRDGDGETGIGLDESVRQGFQAGPK